MRDTVGVELAYLTARLLVATPRTGGDAFRRSVVLNRPWDAAPHKQALREKRATTNVVLGPQQRQGSQPAGSVGGHG